MTMSSIVKVNMLAAQRLPSKNHVGLQMFNLDSIVDRKVDLLVPLALNKSYYHYINHSFNLLLSKSSFF